MPFEILIIDDGELSQENISKIISNCNTKGINLVYYKKNQEKEKRGSSESRNKALSLAICDIMFILDDDVILNMDFFEKILKIWNDNKDQNLMGVGGIIINNRKKTKYEDIYNKIFLIDSIINWDVNNLAYQVWDEKIKNKMKSYYVHGGVCSYNRKLAYKIKFSTFSGGRTALEDVDFCLRVKNMGYFFIIEPEAKVIHNISNINRENKYLMGIKESYNRKIIFKNNCEQSLKSYLYFYWAFFGWLLRQFIAGNIIKALGMIKGMVKR